MVSFVKVYALSAAFLLQLTAACTHCDCNKEKTYALSLTDDAEAQDAAVIDLKNCQYNETSCIKGKADGKTYQFGFAGNPNVLIGNIGEVKHELHLAQDKVESYGNGVLELPFFNNDTGVMVILNWSSKKKRFIGHEFNAVGQD
jgi:hypothetical protein